MLNIYTIGSITYYQSIEGNIDKAKEWREKIKTMLRNFSGIYIFDPTLAFEKVKNNNLGVNQNDHFMRNSDIGICNLKYLEHSPGSIYELVIMKSINKPVFAFGSSHFEFMNSPHISSCITDKFNNLEDLMGELNNLYFQYY